MTNDAIQSLVSSMNSSSVADSNAISLALALASASLPDGEGILERLAKEVPDQTFLGLDDHKATERSRARLRHIIEQAINARKQWIVKE